MAKKFFPKKPKPIVMTKEGLDEITREFEKLTLYRKEVIERLKVARAMGDLSENAAYSAAKHEQRTTDRRLRYLEKLIKRAVVKKKTTSGKADFGSTITIKNNSKTMTFTLVSGHESDPAKHKLSVYSPIGKAVQGKIAGENINVHTPSGKTSYTIVKIE